MFQFESIIDNYSHNYKGKAFSEIFNREFFIKLTTLISKDLESKTKVNFLSSSHIVYISDSLSHFGFSIKNNSFKLAIVLSFNNNVLYTLVSGEWLKESSRKYSIVNAKFEKINIENFEYLWNQMVSGKI